MLMKCVDGWVCFSLVCIGLLLMMIMCSFGWWVVRCLKVCRVRLVFFLGVSWLMCSSMCCLVLLVCYLWCSLGLCCCGVKCCVFILWFRICRCLKLWVESWWVSLIVGMKLRLVMLCRCFR